jgi:YgiT-type zinc finger domain-containing protein
MDEDLEKRWRELSEEVLSGMKEWRLARPNATFREIEEAVHERVSRLEARLLQGTVLTDERADWVQAPTEQRPTCPTCGIPLVSRGKRKRALQSRGGQTITLSRSYGTCPACGMGLFPPR